MVQRNTEGQQRSLAGMSRREGAAISPGIGGSGTHNIQTGLPGNLMSPKDLATVPAEAAVVGEQYLVFTLLERELAIKAEYIQSVERLADVTPVPNVASWITGVINLRGSIASVVDLRAFLDMEVLPHSPRTRLLAVKYNEMVICLVVDSVSEMVPVPPTAINGNLRQAYIPQWLAPYAAGSAVIGKRQIVLLDAARLLFSDKMQHFS